MKHSDKHDSRTGLPDRFRLVIFASLLILCPIHSTRGYNGSSTGGSPPVKTDSLASRIRNLRREASQLRLRADSLRNTVSSSEAANPPNSNANIADIESGPQSAMEFNREKDTVQFISREGVQAFLQTLRGRRRGGRERGYGGGIGPVPAIHAVGINPVKDVLEYLSSSQGSEFYKIGFPVNPHFENFFLMGLTGYGALGNGFRIGGSFHGGSKTLSTRNDGTTYACEISTSFGGLLLEKSVVSGSLNWFLGGLVGGGNTELRLHKTGASAMEIELAVQEYEASSALLELHGGFTWTMISWFHFGINCSIPLLFSPSGFEAANHRSLTTGFFTINPGFSFRIILGNIG